MIAFDNNGVDEGSPSFDDALLCKEEADSDQSNHPEGALNRYLLDLCQEIQELQSDLLGLDRSCDEEKVHVKVVLKVQKELRAAPMKAFSHILNWAPIVNDKDGCLFKVDCQPSQKKLWKTCIVGTT